MASVDIIEASGKSYFLLWEEKAYLWKLAMVPILIKLVCDITVYSLGWETDFLKQALIKLPGYMAEGWMLSHFVRLIFLKHRWPFQPTGNVDKDLHDLKVRARGIMGGMVVYTLIKLAIMAFLAFSVSVTGFDADGARMDVEQEPSGGLFLFSVFIFAFFVWIFRFFWLYVPVALNYPMKDYVRGIGGFSSSLNLIGAWLICFLPVFFFLGLFFSAIIGSFESGAPAAAGFVFSILGVLMDTLLSLLTTGGICFVLAEMLGGQKGSPKNGGKA